MTPLCSLNFMIFSLLLAGSSEEAVQLRNREALLKDRGIECRFLSADEAQGLEPSLGLKSHAGGLLAEADAQIVRGLYGSFSRRYMAPACIALL